MTNYLCRIHFRELKSVMQLFNFFNNSTQVFTYIGSYVLICTSKMVVYGQIGEQRVNRSNRHKWK